MATEPPTAAPTYAPTEAPTAPPTEPPTAPPTEPPTAAPTYPPTEAPTNAPTDPPTDAPTQPPMYTDAPTTAEPKPNNSYGSGVDSDVWQPANVGAPGPIGPKPDVVEDPRPPGYQGPGINGNGLDGMNVGSGTFNKKISVWRENDGVGTLSCTGGSGCLNMVDDDASTDFYGGSSLSVDFDCINFHEIVWWAHSGAPTQSSYQGVCLYVDDAKVHCWSDTRVTSDYDRLVGSNKGQMMKGVSKVELRWPEGSVSEVSQLRVRYEGCDPVTPVPVYTNAPTEAPTDAPTAPPTEPPTEPPTAPPTAPPTYPPTEPPTEAPTAPPTEPPTAAPTYPPTEAPTAPPTAPPTEPPTAPPTEPPTAAPTYAPTEAPTAPPTEPPTAPPTEPPRP